MAKKNNLVYFLSIALIVIIGFAIVHYINGVKYSELQDNLLKSVANEKRKINEYVEKEKERMRQVARQMERDESRHDSRTETISRDYRVMDDPLYPPLNRSTTGNHSRMMEYIRRREMYVPTQESDDTFRLIGYLVSSNGDNVTDRLKLFAREKNSNQGEYYVTSVNKNYDMKIPITNNMLRGEKLRDVYNIPNVLEFNTPIFGDSTYNYVELPKTDFTNVNYD